MRNWCGVKTEPRTCANPKCSVLLTFLLLSVVIFSLYPDECSFFYSFLDHFNWMMPNVSFFNTHHCFSTANIKFLNNLTSKKIYHQTPHQFELQTDFSTYFLLLLKDFSTYSILFLETLFERHPIFLNLFLECIARDSGSASNNDRSLGFVRTSKRKPFSIKLQIPTNATSSYRSQQMSPQVFVVGCQFFLPPYPQ